MNTLWAGEDISPFTGNLMPLLLSALYRPFSPDRIQSSLNSSASESTLSYHAISTMPSIWFGLGQLPRPVVEISEAI